ncbi:MAG: hypothetical protein J6A79_05685 [Clostridia bacterium]|nr:hypothetical protein [Clostridia bacterium]
MDKTIIVGLLSLAGTLIGTLGGILASNKLITYRIEQLEKKVDQHNNIITRTFQLEGRMNEAEHDIRDLKGAVRT